VQRRSDGKYFTNWAPNANGHYVPTFSRTTDRIDELYIFRTGMMTIRPNNWIIMPAFGQKIRIKINAKYLTFQWWSDEIKDTSTSLGISFNTEVVETEVIRNVGPTTQYAHIPISHIPMVGDLQDFRVASVIAGQAALQEVWA